MSYKIYIGNLTAEVTDDMLRREFETAGELKDLQRLNPGRAFAFYDTLEEAQTAIEKINGMDLAGNKLLVENARSTKRADKGPIRYDLRVRVTNLDRSVSWQDLKDWARDATGADITYSNVFEHDGRQQGLVEFKVRICVFLYVLKVVEIIIMVVTCGDVMVDLVG